MRDNNSNRVPFQSRISPSIAIALFLSSLIEYRAIYILDKEFDFFRFFFTVLGFFIIFMIVTYFTITKK